MEQPQQQNTFKHPPWMLKKIKVIPSISEDISVSVALEYATTEEKTVKHCMGTEINSARKLELKKSRKHFFYLRNKNVTCYVKDRKYAQNSAISQVCKTFFFPR